MYSYLEFEKFVVDIEGKIQELFVLVGEDGEVVQVDSEIDWLKVKLVQILKDFYVKLMLG